MDSLVYYLKPEVAISLGVSSTVIGGYSISFVRNPYINKSDQKTSLAIGLSSTIAGAAFMGPSIEYTKNLQDVEAYIQSLSKEELQDLSKELTLINDNEKEEVIIDNLKSKTIGDFNETYHKIKKHSIWDK